MPRPPSDAPDRILQAAHKILTTSGPSALSFDRVAQEASLSKGGVLHHFRTRKALVAAMVAATLERLDAHIASRTAKDDQRVGAYRRAWVATLLDAADQRDSVAILAAALIEPDLATPVWTWLDQARRRLAAELGPDEALVLSSAVEAWWLGAALGRPALPAHDRLDLVERLTQPR